MSDSGKALGYLRTFADEVSRPKPAAPFAQLPVPDGGPEIGLVICSVCKNLQPAPPSDWHLMARVDDPSGKVKGIIECCKKCRKTPRSAIVTFLSILAILGGVAFASYALTVERRGIDPESHWFGSVSLAVAEWTGRNRENIRDFAKLLDLLLYAGAGLAGALGLSRWRTRKRGRVEATNKDQ